MLKFDELADNNVIKVNQSNHLQRFSPKNNLKKPMWIIKSFVAFVVIFIGLI